MLTHRGLSKTVWYCYLLASMNHGFLVYFKFIHRWVLHKREFGCTAPYLILFEYSLYSSRTEDCEDLIKTNRINNLNIIIKHHVFFKFMVYHIDFFCVSRVQQFLIENIFLHCFLDGWSVDFCDYTLLIQEGDYN